MNELYHYGRLGMKWYQHLFGDEDPRAKYSKTYTSVEKSNKALEERIKYDPSGFQREMLKKSGDYWFRDRSVSDRHKEWMRIAQEVNNSEDMKAWYKARDKIVDKKMKLGYNDKLIAIARKFSQKFRDAEKEFDRMNDWLNDFKEQTLDALAGVTLKDLGYDDTQFARSLLKASEVLTNYPKKKWYYDENGRYYCIDELIED